MEEVSKMRRYLAILIAALACLAWSGSASAAAPIKRLVWVKASAAWTAHASHDVTCSPYSASKATLSCTFYDRSQKDGRTFIADGFYKAFGQYQLSRAGDCSYTLKIYGPALEGGGATPRTVTINACKPNWLAKLPRAL